MLAPRLPEHAAGRVAAWLKASRMPHPPPDESEKRAATASQQRGAIGRAGARVYRHLPILKTSAQPFCDFVGPPTNWILTAISCHRRALPPAHPTASPPARRVERQRAACRRSSRCDVCHRAPVEQCCPRTDVHSMNKDQTHAPHNGPLSVHASPAPDRMHQQRSTACTRGLDTCNASGGRSPTAQRNRRSARLGDARCRAMMARTTVPSAPGCHELNATALHVVAARAPGSAVSCRSRPIACRRLQRCQVARACQDRA